MENFGYMDKLNGLDHLPYWDESPCNAIRASEGKFSIDNSDELNNYSQSISWG